AVRVMHGCSQKSLHTLLTFAPPWPRPFGGRLRLAQVFNHSPRGFAAGEVLLTGIKLPSRRASGAWGRRGSDLRGSSTLPLMTTPGGAELDRFGTRRAIRRESRMDDGRLDRIVPSKLLFRLRKGTVRHRPFANGPLAVTHPKRLRRRR